MLYRLSAIEGGSPSARSVQSSSSGQYRAAVAARATPSERSERSCTRGKVGSEEPDEDSWRKQGGVLNIPKWEIQRGPSN